MNIHITANCTDRALEYLNYVKILSDLYSIIATATPLTPKNLPYNNLARSRRDYRQALATTLVCMFNVFIGLIRALNFLK